MSFLLMVGLTLVCLPREYPAPWLDLTVGQSALIGGLYVAFVGLHAFWVSRRVSWPLDADPSLRDALLGRYEMGRFVHQLLLIGLYAALLLLFGWGWAVRVVWSRGGASLPGTELATLMPFFLAQVLGWVFFYDADHAAHQAAHRLLDGRGGSSAGSFAHTWLEAQQVSSPPFGGRWTYVGFQLRQKLALVFVPVFLVIALTECERQLPTSWQQWPPLGQGLGMGLLAVLLVGWPLMIRLVLGLRPLPAGPLRDRLMASAARLGFRCGDVLVWDTRNGMANAMIVGVVPPLRYVIFTDRLLDEFTEDEVEAVFGHEIGHVRHQHMLYYLSFLALSMTVLGLLADYLILPWLGRVGAELAGALPDVVPASTGEWLGPEGDLAPVPVVALMLAYFFTAFGFLSRWCERQADVVGCRAVSCDDPACRAHEPATPLAPGGRCLCPTGIHTFIQALEKVALVNGISRDRPGFFQSWQHGSIARRVAFLLQARSDPRVERRFQRWLRGVKWAVVLGLAALLGLLIHLFVLDLVKGSPRPRDASPRGQATHGST